MLKDPSTDSLRFDYTMDEENQFSSTKQRPKKTAPTVYREQVMETCYCTNTIIIVLFIYTCMLP